MENLSFYGSLALFIFGFGFLVFIHELGHFAVAKWVGVRCKYFAVGMGFFGLLPPICSYRKGVGFRFGGTDKEYEAAVEARLREKHIDPDHATPAEIYEAGDEVGMSETEYRWMALPIGGYVQMEGQEDMDPAKRSNDPNAFHNKPIWARMAVISAGVVMNIITGVVMFIIAFMAGVQFPAPVVGDVLRGSPAALAQAVGHEGDPAYRGLRVGDRIVAVDGEAARDFSDVQVTAALGHPETPISLTVTRPGEAQPLTYTLHPMQLPGERLLAVGLGWSSTLRVNQMAKESDLYAAGVRPGMTLVAVDGQPVATRGELYAAAARSGGRPLTVTFEKRSEESEGTAVDEGEGGEGGEGGAVVRVEAQLPTKATLAGTMDQPGNLAGLVPAVAIQPEKPDTPAAKAGVEAGDLLLEVDGVRWPTTRDLVTKVSAAAAAERGVKLTVWREGEAVKLPPIVADDDTRRIGVKLEDVPEAPVLGTTLPGSPAATLNLPGGSRLLSIGGREVASWHQVQTALRDAALAAKVQEPGDEGGDGAEGGEGAKLEVEVTAVPPAAGAAPITRTMTLDADALAGLRAVSWEPALLESGLAFYTEQVRVSTSNPLEASWIGIEKTHQFIVQTYLTLVRLFQGTVGVSDLRGPVGIVDEGRRVAVRGWPYIMFFLGLLSVNLAVINFLPIPIVDGGQMVFLIIEKIKGSPVSAAVQQGALIVGLVILGLIFVTTTFYDISRIFGVGG